MNYKVFVILIVGLLLGSFGIATVAAVPIVKDPSPANGATDVSLTPDLMVEVDGANNQNYLVKFYGGSTFLGSAVVNTKNNSVDVATVQWPGRSPSITYSWYVTVADNADPDIVLYTSDTWSFTTRAPGIDFSNPVPSGISGVGPSTTLSIDISGGTGTVTVNFYNSGDSTLIGTDTVTGSGTATTVWNYLESNTTYSWHVIATDSTGSYTSPNYSFATGTQSDVIFTHVSINTDTGGITVRVDISAANTQSNTSLFLYVYDENDNIVTTYPADDTYPDHRYMDVGVLTMKPGDTRTEYFSTFYLTPDDLRKDFRVCVYWQKTNVNAGSPSHIIAGPSCDSFYYIPSLGTLGFIGLLALLLLIAGYSMRKNDVLNIRGVDGK